MSLFQSASAACPVCGTPHTFEVVASVNADRRPDLRAAILDASFQREQCAKCGEAFVAAPMLTYLDVESGWWILVEPAHFQQKWQALGAVAREGYDKAYGGRAPSAARELGRGLKVRVVFGWGALREKLRCADLGLDDVDLELLKMAVVRNTKDSPLADDNELRLLGVQGDDLLLGWIVAATEKVVATQAVPRSTYDEVARDRKAWQAVRQDIASHPFVDMNRLLLAD